MSDFGVTDKGFALKRLADVRDSITSDFRSEFGNQTKTGPRSVFGQLIAILSRVVYRQWELAQIAWFILDPDQAEGVHLENLAKIIGLQKIAAQHSRATLTLTGDIGATVESGAVVSHSGTGERFATVETVELEDEDE